MRSGCAERDMCTVTRDWCDQNYGEQNYCAITSEPEKSLDPSAAS